MKKDASPVLVTVCLKRNRGLIVVGVIDLPKRSKTVTGVDCQRKSNIVGRLPNRLHRWIVNSDISRHSEEHHRNRSELFTSFDFFNGRKWINRVDDRYPF